MSVGPSAVKIRCQVKNIIDNRRLTLSQVFLSSFKLLIIFVGNLMLLKHDTGGSDV